MNFFYRNKLNPTVPNLWRIRYASAEGFIPIWSSFQLITCRQQVGYVQGFLNNRKEIKRIEIVTLLNVTEVDFVIQYSSAARVVNSGLRIIENLHTTRLQRRKNPFWIHD